MWVAKFKFDGSKVFFGEIAKKFNVSFTGYPLSSYEKNNQLYVTIIGTVKGEKKEKILQYMKKNSLVLKIEEHNNFFSILIKENNLFKPFYSPYFIYISPVFIDEKGMYSYHLGCWQREELQKLLSVVQKKYASTLVSMKQEKLQYISILGIQPNLTEKQKSAYELAVKEGYYAYPKKIELKQLAKISKIAYATYQQHLKYAEKKIHAFFTHRYQYRYISVKNTYGSRYICLYLSQEVNEHYANHPRRIQARKRNNNEKLPDNRLF
ncbi:hypothetical protein C4573_05185 [Candidatus Woesearchaeota archaeon]|nr:MAG: hypothetical protein C4573_05185 [Candidatus Woesearchaeota archaeon]